MPQALSIWLAVFSCSSSCIFHHRYGVADQNLRSSLLCSHQEEHYELPDHDEQILCWSSNPMKNFVPRERFQLKGKWKIIFWTFWLEILENIFGNWVGMFAKTWLFVGTMYRKKWTSQIETFHEVGNLLKSTETINYAFLISRGW